MQAKKIIFADSDMNKIMPMPKIIKFTPKNSIGTPIVTGGRVMPIKRGSISILSSSIAFIMIQKCYRQLLAHQKPE